MAGTFIEPGNVGEYTAPSGGVVSGVPYLIGSLLVIALGTAAQGATFRGAIVGVFKYVKAASQVWAEGVKIYWDNTAKNFTTTSSANTLVGTVFIAALSADVVGYVRLDGVAR